MNDILYIEWIDSGAMKGNWNESYENFEESMNMCNSVGFLLNETQHWLVICSTLGNPDIPSEDIGNLTYIYKPCITKREIKGEINGTK